MGLEPVWLQSALPVFHCHCEDDDFGALGFRKPWEAFLCLKPVWLSENPIIAFKMRRCGKTEIAVRESCRPPPRAPVGENNSTAHLCEQIEVNSDEEAVRAASKVEEVYDAIAVDLALVMIEGKHDPMTPTYFRKMNALNSVAKINHAKTLNKIIGLTKVSPVKSFPTQKTPTS